MTSNNTSLQSGYVDENFETLSSHQSYVSESQEELPLKQRIDLHENLQRDWNEEFQVSITTLICRRMQSSSFWKSILSSRNFQHFPLSDEFD
jgi:hypothetical protein